MSDLAKAVFIERHGQFGQEIVYVQPSGQRTIVPLLEENDLNNIKIKLMRFLGEVFLPQGFPSSVSEDYIHYQLWDTLQAFCSSINGILATQAILRGVGVGDAESTPLAATITWVIKDGTGHIGRIAFAWWKGSSLDSESKKWRLIADILNDMALSVELCLPFFYGFTTYVLCLSTMMKAIVGVAGGATRAALTQHHAVRGNLGDVAAKDGSQETAVNLVASLFGIAIISMFKESVLDTLNIWIPFLTFTILHIIANYLAVTSVCLNTFNVYRFFDSLYFYLTENNFVSPKEVNNREPILFETSLLSKMTKIPITVGQSLQYLIRNKKISLEEIQNAINRCEDLKYLVLVDNDNHIHVALKNMSDSKEILQAYFHASLIGIVLHCEDELLLNSVLCKSCKKDKNIFREYDSIKEIAVNKWTIFFEGLKYKGWTFERHLIPCGEWRVQ